ncbi:MAG: AbrB/MazE/SpoVT family DNA-binding domain-containing protein [Verrucomicrobiota bacterium]
MKLTSKGQVTVPQHIRRFLGISVHSEVDFEIREDQVILVKTSQRSGDSSRFSRLRGSLKDAESTDQILKTTRGEDWG